MLRFCFSLAAWKASRKNSRKEVTATTDPDDSVFMPASFVHPPTPSYRQRGARVNGQMPEIGTASDHQQSTETSARRVPATAWMAGLEPDRRAAGRPCSP